ncbi:MAG TPA: GNAT family N-acetyltransferase [Chryseolinea sp.]
MPMESPQQSQQPLISHAEPILPVADITATVDYWHEVLGFPEKWTWGEPPNHGGVRWHGAHIQFTLNPPLAAVSGAQAIFIVARHVQALYALHQSKNVEIVAPLENKPWGMAGYIVREMNGYYINFAGALIGDQEHDHGHAPVPMRIVHRVPTPAEYSRLSIAVGWSKAFDTEVLSAILSSVVYAVVAEHPQTGEAIGCALLIGDNASIYYVKDVMVHPDWQHQGVGTALMEELVQWFDAKAPHNALATLITGENLAQFYQPLGFTPAFGMMRWSRKPGSDKK